MWPRVGAAAVGLWLMVAPAVMGYAGTAATNDRIAGPIVAGIAIVAMAEATRSLRWLNVVAGLWLVAAPWVLEYPLGVLLNSTGSGLVLIGLAARRGRLRHRIGGGWRAVLRRNGAAFVVWTSSAGLLLLTAQTPAGALDSTTVERSDNGFYIVVDEAGNQKGAGSALAPLTPGDDFGVMLHARAADRIITVWVTLDNRTTSDVSFPDGLEAHVPITLDGTALRTVTLVKQGVKRLTPGESVVVSGTTKAEGPGVYAFTALVEIQRGAVSYRVPHQVASAEKIAGLKEEIARLRAEVALREAGENADG